MVVLSGMAHEFDFVLVERLKRAARRKAAFFIDSWKFLTRNPHKLFLALEYVLASGAKSSPTMPTWRMGRCLADEAFFGRRIWVRRSLPNPPSEIKVQPWFTGRR